MEKTYLGIDVGKEGALVALITDENNNITNIDINKIPKIGKEYDIQGCIDVLEKYQNLTVILENPNVHAAKGRSAAASMGEGKMIWKALLVALKIKHQLVSPQTWQKVMWEGVQIQYKTLSPRKVKDTKATSKLTAQRLFPDVSFKKSSRAKNDDDNIIDALLIAEYGRRKL